LTTRRRWVTVPLATEAVEMAPLDKDSIGSLPPELTFKEKTWVWNPLTSHLASICLVKNPTEAVYDEKTHPFLNWLVVTVMIKRLSRSCAKQSGETGIRDIS